VCAADAAADEAIEDEDDDVLIDCCIIIFCAVVPIPFIPIMMMIEWDSRPLQHVPHIVIFLAFHGFLQTVHRLFFAVKALLKRSRWPLNR